MEYLVRITKQPRDKTFIRKDILLRLAEVGEINQTKLLTLCGLNIVKHKQIILDMVEKGLVIQTLGRWGHKNMIKYKITHEGSQFYQNILIPYVTMFPRYQ